ncbi:hypothetical protein [uncultured Desulfosarcina sp.]|uniref:hypothetical protein n=1 Tax=uncultured Desulfosarcina sp. TaxID=218289 RepID=UPI0029C6EE43|nr:hypothetical protein [uncultured Desulfosarcina sp.]
MDLNVIQRNKERLAKSIPVVSRYLDKFHSINTRWAGAITAGMIETGCMPVEATKLFTPLIQEMRSTMVNYGQIQQRLVDAILFEMVKKVVLEIADSAKFAINILKRNLFERTADVGYLATDAEIVDFLKQMKEGGDPDEIARRSETIRQRLADYQYEYTVYNEILVLDMKGQVQANLDAANTVRYSTDPLLKKTHALHLRNDTDDNYVETYRETDLQPGRGKALIYSQKIEDPEQHTALGSLCLCFDFEDEMEGIFKDLNQGNPQIVVAIIDANGSVMCSNNATILPPAFKITVDLNADFRFLTIQGRTYLASMVATDGYQGFYGLTWYAVSMIDIGMAFKTQHSGDTLGKALVIKLQDFSGELSSIKHASEELLDDMKLDSINGRVQATKFQAKAFVEVLQYVKWIGEEVDDLFNAAIQNLQETIVTSLFNDMQFRAFQGNSIADRNLYERANDVCWWALTPMFRRLLTKHHNHSLHDAERQALTDNLQYINNLYTPYLRLVLADPQGVVIAVSNPPEELSERLLDDGLPVGQDIVGMQLDHDFVHKTLRLSSSRDYRVSKFLPTPLYGGRATYIYSTAVRDPENDQRVVGIIQIVFDAEPQF